MTHLAAPRAYDLVLYGATGLTAGAALKEIINSTRWPQDFSYAIAGRNRAALDQLRVSSYKDVPQAVVLPDIIVADVRDDESLTAMARQTKLLLNCVGPYRDYGEPVVKACIQTGTDYLDLCGEPGFIEQMHLKYHDAAVQANVTIVHAAAFDSVPCDLGVVLCKKILAERGAYPSSVEMFFSLNVTGRLRNKMNYATYESAVKGFASIAALREGRRELARVRPKPAPVGSPLNSKGSGILARFGVLQHQSVTGWLIPYFFSDPAVVRLTQSLTLHLKKPTGSPPAELAPVHFAAYIQITRLRYVFTFILYFVVFQFLAVRAWGRSLLYRYPGFFTGGLAAKKVVADEKSRDSTSFTQTFIAKGYSPSLHPTPRNSPDVRVQVRITGPEPGYYATSVIFTEAARVLLKRRHAIPRGVLTPAVAFGDLDTFAQEPGAEEGGIMDALQKDGRVTWKMLSS